MTTDDPSEADLSTSHCNIFTTAGDFGASAPLVTPDVDTFLHPNAETADDVEPPETYELLAIKDAWVGRAPLRIDGKVNPDEHV